MIFSFGPTLLVERRLVDHGGRLGNPGIVLWARTVSGIANEISGWSERAARDRGVLGYVLFAL